MVLGVNKNERLNVCKYYNLFNMLRNKPYFLYNFAIRLYNDELFIESLRVAMLCKQICSGYDVEMLLAENYGKLEMYTEAERLYTVSIR